MSLQVWLPLNGNLNNQGLGDITATSGSPVYKNGKVTSNSLNLNQRIYFTCPQLANLQTFSVCFWGMTEDSSTITTNWQDLIGFNDVSSSGTTGTFRWESYYSATNNLNGIHWHDNGTNALVSGSVHHNTSRNEWCHCCVVFDAENEKIYSYSNGELIATHTHLKGHFNTSGQFYLGETNNIEGRIQDVRFYDHALSPKEVKEISKGLVLHYRLSGIGNDNLLTNSATFSGYSIGGTLDTTETYYGCNSVKTNKAWWGPYINLKDIITKNNLSVGDTVTYSIMAKTNFNGTCNFTLFRAASSGICSFSKSFIANEWQKLSVTFSITDYALTSMTARLECNTPNTGSPNYYLNTGENNYMWFAQPKLELSSTATPWCPNSSDILYSTLGYNDNIEYDCSGYSNNGTKSGTIICDSDSPRYTTSYKFGSTSTKIKLPTMTYSNFGNSYTFSWWQKNTSSGNMPWGFSDGNRLNLYHTTNLCWNTGNGSNNPFKDSNGNALPQSKLCDSTWHHCAIVGNGSSTLLYIDGINAGTATTYKSLTGTQIYISGWDSGTSYTFNGSNLVDFRIYSTALSATDIKELYNTSFIVDNSGKAYAYEYIES